MRGSIITNKESVIDKAKRVFNLDNMVGTVGVVIAIILAALIIYWVGTIIFKHIKRKSKENNRV